MAIPALLEEVQSESFWPELPAQDQELRWEIGQDLNESVELKMVLTNLHIHLYERMPPVVRSPLLPLKIPAPKTLDVRLELHE